MTRGRWSVYGEREMEGGAERGRDGERERKRRREGERESLRVNEAAAGSADPAVTGRIRREIVIRVLASLSVVRIVER